MARKILVGLLAACLLLLCLGVGFIVYMETRPQPVTPETTVPTTAPAVETTETTEVPTTEAPTTVPPTTEAPTEAPTETEPQQIRYTLTFANLREPLWKSLDEAKEQVLYGLQYADILKISDNEIQWLTGEEDYTEGVKKIREMKDIPLILVSMGKEGSRAYYKDMIVEVKPFLQENTIETTGAGDTFCANVLNYVLENGLEDLTAEGLEEMLTFANAAASIITTKKGALRVMPTKEDVENFLKSVK